jgi:hypothetical protein
MGAAAGFIILFILWVVGCLAIIILPFVFIAMASRPPRAPLLPALPDPPARAKRAKPEPKPRPRPRPTLTRQQVEDMGPVVHPKWDGTYRWRVGEDKKEWDRDFRAAEERAKQQPAPAGDVYARLRSRLEDLG